MGLGTRNALHPWDHQEGVPRSSERGRSWPRSCEISDGCEVSVMETRLRSRRKDSEKEVAALQAQIVTRATAKKAQEAGIDPEVLTGSKTPPAAKAESPTNRGSSQKTRLSTKRPRDALTGTSKRFKEARRTTRTAARSGDPKPGANRGSTPEAGPSTDKGVPADPKLSGQQPDSAVAMDRRQKTSGDGSRDKGTSAEDVSRAMLSPRRFICSSCIRSLRACCSCVLRLVKAGSAWILRKQPISHRQWACLIVSHSCAESHVGVALYSTILLTTGS